ncbi:unnamed protein product, partial [Rotaria sp. Silwood2]
YQAKQHSDSILESTVSPETEIYDSRHHQKTFNE